jgi:hypothetical protein
MRCLFSPWRSFGKSLCLSLLLASVFGGWAAVSAWLKKARSPAQGRVTIKPITPAAMASTAKAMAMARWRTS